MLPRQLAPPKPRAPASACRSSASPPPSIADACAVELPDAPKVSTFIRVDTFVHSNGGRINEGARRSRAGRPKAHDAAIGCGLHRRQLLYELNRHGGGLGAPCGGVPVGTAGHGAAVRGVFSSRRFGRNDGDWNRYTISRGIGMICRDRGCYLVTDCLYDFLFLALDKHRRADCCGKEYFKQFLRC